MGYFQDFFADFEGWDISTAQFYSVANTERDPLTNLLLNPVDSALGDPVQVGKWVDKAQESNANNKFLNKEVGSIVMDYPAFTLNIGDYAIISNVKYDIEGVDNIGSMNEVLKITYLRDTST